MEESINISSRDKRQFKGYLFSYLHLESNSDISFNTLPCWGNSKIHNFTCSHSSQFCIWLCRHKLSLKSSILSPVFIYLYLYQFPQRHAMHCTIVLLPSCKRSFVIILPMLPSNFNSTNTNHLRLTSSFNSCLVNYHLKELETLYIKSKQTSLCKQKKQLLGVHVICL